MSISSMFRRAFTKQDNTATAKVRVGGRGEVFIPSQEIAGLPEVQEMQRKAFAIVNKTALVRQQKSMEALAGTPEPRKA
ncbi:hypothetical protein ABEG72_16165 [Pantoea agglomerans]|uniref:hypothetical protein n=1 Tax=Enterobacter agglomerans TaxID=549 RepID=UPI003208A78B